MSSVVISNRSIFNQRVSSIENNKVLLPFNVSKEQGKKLTNLLSNIKVTFLSEQDKLDIGELVYNNLNIKSSDREIGDSRFTLSKTYVVTMKQGFVSKVKSFYDRVVKPKEPERPIFNIGNETNLQQALAEATTEIDLSTVNASLNQSNVINPQQVLANDPLGEKVIENGINLDNTTSVKNETVVNSTHEEANLVQNSVNTQTVGNLNQEIPLEAQAPVLEQPKVKVKKLKGNVLIVPVVVVWLAAVFFGTLKLVTGILS